LIFLPPRSAPAYPRTSPLPAAAASAWAELGLGSPGIDGPGARIVELHPNHDPKEKVFATLQRATEFPLYYVRHYGPRNGDRVDRQLTYLWSAKFSKRHEDIAWRFDDEVAEHKWMSLDAALAWLAEDATKYNETFVGEAGVTDDGPDVGDFCHRTIRTLYGAGLAGMM